MIDIITVMLWMLLVAFLSTGFMVAVITYPLHLAWIWMTIMVTGLIWTRKFFK